MAKYKYLFIRMDEDGVVTQLTADLNDFRSFCHYSGLSEWTEHAELIKKCLQKTCQYAFTGNDVWYYILIHPTWDDITSSELTITIKEDN